DVQLPGRVLIPAWLGPQRLTVTTIAVGLATEQCVAALGRVGIEVDAGARLYRRQRQLIKVQGGQLAGDLIVVGISRDVAEPGLCGDGKLLDVVESLIEERANAVQFVDRHEGVPVRDRAPTARPGVQVVTR